jgi:hypothetical protein
MQPDQEATESDGSEQALTEHHEPAGAESRAEDAIGPAALAGAGTGAAGLGSAAAIGAMAGVPGGPAGAIVGGVLGAALGGAVGSGIGAAVEHLGQDPEHWDMQGRRDPQHDS